MIPLELFDDIAGDLEAFGTGDGLGLFAIYVLVVVPLDVFEMVGIDEFVALLFDVFELVIFNNKMAVVEDIFEAVVFNTDVHVLFGMDEDLLIVLVVFETELIEAAAALGGVAFDRGDRLFGGERIRRLVVFIVDASGDDGPIGVAFEEIDDDFLTDARREEDPVVFAGPILGNADPATGFLMAFGGGIPEKFHFDAAVFIGPDFFTILADDDRGLRPLNTGFGRDACRAEWDSGGNDGDLGLKCRGIRTITDAHFIVVELIAGGGDEKVDGGIDNGMTVKLEGSAGADAAGGAGSSRHGVLGGDLFNTDFRVEAAFVRGGVHAGIVVEFGSACIVGVLYLDGIVEIGVGCGVVIIRQRVGTGGEFIFLNPIPCVSILIFAFIRFIEGKRFIIGGFCMGCRRIAQDKRVLALFVLEVVIDAFIFHEAGDEVEISLAVLDAIIPFAIFVFFGEGVFDVAAVVAEDGLNDVRNTLSLEDAATGGAGEEPEPRNERHSVVIDDAGALGLIDGGEDEAGDETVEVARGSLLAVEQ